MLTLFRIHSLQEAAIKVAPVVYTTYDMARELGRWNHMEALALEHGIFTQAELEYRHASCERANDKGSFFLHVNMVMTVGRRR